MLISDLRDRFFNYLGFYHDREILNQITIDFRPDLEIIKDIYRKSYSELNDEEVNCMNLLNRKYLKGKHHFLLKKCSPDLRKEFGVLLEDICDLLADYRKNCSVNSEGGI